LGKNLDLFLSSPPLAQHSLIAFGGFDNISKTSTTCITFKLIIMGDSTRIIVKGAYLNHFRL